MSARIVDRKGKEMRSVSGASALSLDPFRFSVRASLSESGHHCVDSCRLGNISVVSTYIVEDGTFGSGVRSYLLLSCFGMGQLALEGREDSVVGGSLLSLFAKFGFSTGSFASLGWMLFD